MSEPGDERVPGPGELSDDTLLDGKVRLLQPSSGYRVAIDSVLLSASVAAAPGDRVLDLGTGVGAAALCLAWRVGAVRVVGVELQRGLARLATENARLNGLSQRVDVIIGDVARLPPRLAPGSFHHVMANPPYLALGRASAPPDPAKALANVEGEADIATWVRAAIGMARPKGTLTFIYRSDRIEELLAQLAGRVGEIVVFPLWPAEGKPAKRVIVRARKDVATPTRLAPGLVLHEADGRFTAAADAILRGGAGLIL